MAHTNLSLWGEFIGHPELAIWCDTCMLPSAVRFHVVVGTGMSVVGDWFITRCVDCGRDEREWGVG